MNKIDLVGKRFGRWLVICSSPTVNRRARWECICDCGNEKNVSGYMLRSGRSTSCGCFRREVTSSTKKTHGLSESRTHKIWASMKGRCRTSSHTSYPQYGARGISYAPRWELFQNFLDDMGEAPDGLELDRINNDGDYGPNNCRWVTHRDNCSNTRCSRIYQFRGQRLSIEQIANFSTLSPWTVRWRINQGWPLERAVTAPLYAAILGCATPPEAPK
jgi:hypothetical protein